MNSCVICKLVNKELPSWVVYEDEAVICFLPLDLEAYGHTIIAPKAHHDDLFVASTEVLSLVLSVTQKIARHYRQVIGATGINLLHASGVTAQQSVPHFHMHLIPRFDKDGLDAWPTFPKTQFSKDELLQRLRL
jgi:histidine triad (HIT) family protein